MYVLFCHMLCSVKQGESTKYSSRVIKTVKDGNLCKCPKYN